MLFLPLQVENPKRFGIAEEEPHANGFLRVRGVLEWSVLEVQVSSTSLPLRRREMPRSSIMIVARNAGRVLSECVESVRRSTSDYEIIIMDNASTDGSIEMVRFGRDVRLLRFSSNLGHSRAFNVGIREARGRFIVNLDLDTILTPGWLDRLVEAAQGSNSIGMVAPKLLRPGNPPVLDSTGHVYQFQTGLARDRGQGERDFGQYDDWTELVSCCFAAVLIKREVLENIGLPDPHMFTVFSDVDFGLRAKLAGWRIIFRPDSVVYHFRGGSTLGPVQDRIKGGGTSPLGLAYPLHTVLKIYQRRNALLVGGRIFLMWLVRAVAGIKNRDLVYASGSLYATLWTVAHLPIRERLVFQRCRRLSDSALVTVPTQHDRRDRSIDLVRE